MDSEQRERFWNSLTNRQKLALKYQWKFWARPDQLQPEIDWDYWLVQAGRGYGKTRTGAELVIEWAKVPGTRIHLVGATASDVREVMIGGESGVMARSAPWFYPKWSQTKHKLIWPNGSIAQGFTSERPDRMRGPQAHKGWADEVAAWRYPDALDQLLFGCRLPGRGRNQVLFTTTPKGSKTFKEVLSLAKPVAEGEGPTPVMMVTRGRTRDNIQNLSARSVDRLIQRYSQTRLGRQELDGEYIEDNEKALWRRSWIDSCRLARPPENLERIVVAIDPNASDNEDSDEIGIVVVGSIGDDGYVLEDASMMGTPLEWARTAVRMFHKWKADRIVAEANNGGNMVEHTIRQEGSRLPVRLVYASRGKVTRAEPISALYERGLFHHVGTFAMLEDQMCQWEPGQPSPDRMDALVWGASALFGEMAGEVYGF